MVKSPLFSPFLPVAIKHQGGARRCVLEAIPEAKAPRARDLGESCFLDGENRDVKTNPFTLW